MHAKSTDTRTNIYSGEERAFRNGFFHIMHGDQYGWRSALPSKFVVLRLLFYLSHPSCATHSSHARLYPVHRQSRCSVFPQRFPRISCIAQKLRQDVFHTEKNKCTILLNSGRKARAARVCRALDLIRCRMRSSTTHPGVSHQMTP
jgi:hypothetical protein